MAEAEAHLRAARAELTGDRSELAAELEETITDVRETRARMTQPDLPGVQEHSLDVGEWP